MVGSQDAPRTDATAASSTVLTLPNVISALRLLAVPLFAGLLLARLDGWALLVLAVAGASDWLDGHLARALGQQSRLGELLDPAADRLFIVVTLVVLTMREVVPLWLVGSIVVRELLLGVVLAVLVRRGVGPLPVHLLGKAGTFALLYAFPLLLLAEWQVGSPVGTVGHVVGWAFAGWGLGVYWLAAVLYVRQAVGELRARRSRQTPSTAGAPVEGRP